MSKMTKKERQAFKKGLGYGYKKGKESNKENKLSGLTRVTPIFGGDKSKPKTKVHSVRVNLGDMKRSKSRKTISQSATQKAFNRLSKAEKVEYKDLADELNILNRKKNIGIISFSEKQALIGVKNRLSQLNSKRYGGNK